MMSSKKILIPIIVILLVICVGIGFFIASDSEKTGKPDSDIKTEQGKDEEEQADIEILGPEEIQSEDSSDVSGSWDDTEETDNPTDNKDTNDKEEQVDNNTPNDKEDDSEASRDDEDILDDDITWGEVY